jgi:signal transduction histidine kinase
VTERVRDQQRLRDAEEALRHAQKLESIGQLTGGVAHDFNNLLTVFANGLELLERRIGAEQREIVLKGMRRAVARGTGLTRHLLAFSRRRPLNPESINLAAHLTGMHEILGRSLGGNIHIEMKLAADLWPVEIDVGELDLAMLNLCVNSRDAMPGGGTITIAAENMQEREGEVLLNDFVKLSIADTGSGMPPEV